MSQLHLGFMFAAGDSDTRNEKMAKQGEPTAQYQLGVRYLEGPGTEVDQVPAHLWLSIAMRGGLRNASPALKYVAGWMSKAQIGEAKQLAQICAWSNFANCK